MLDIVRLYETIHRRKYTMLPFNTERSYTYLNNLRDACAAKILIVGCKSHSKYDTLPTFDIDQISSKMNNYDIIVLDKYICRLKNTEIKSIINILINNKKSFIFSGYSTYLNMNIDNHDKMFRPIDITKYPFNITNNSSVIKQQYSKKHVILYGICIVTIIHGNWIGPRILYKVAMLGLILSLFVFPRKKVLYITA